MTAGQDGTPENPENDDPFGYLYRSEDGSQQPAAPRTSYNQVQRVGERRPQQPPQQPQAQPGYGYPPQQPGGYGYPQQAPGGYGYPPQQGQSQGDYGYPPQQPYGGEPQAGQPQYTQQQPQYTQRQPQYAPRQPDGDRHDGGSGGRGSGGGMDGNRKGLLIGAIAVVVAVAIGIGIAMTNSSGKGDQADDKPTATATSAPTTEPSSSPTPSATPTQFVSDKVDAATLTLAGGAQQSTEWTGANAAGGTYVDHMNEVGASATWTVEVPEDGEYTFFIDYGNASDDATLSLAVNGKLRTTPVNLSNWGHSTEWADAWNNTTYAYVNLVKGSNTLQLLRQESDKGGVNLDQVWLKQGKVKK
jgi:hypothetical protein